MCQCPRVVGSQTSRYFLGVLTFLLSFIFAAGQQVVPNQPSIVRRHSALDRHSARSTSLESSGDGAVIGSEGTFLRLRSGGLEPDMQGVPVTWTMPGLPATIMKQEGGIISERQWPAAFCVNVKIQAPDATDYIEPIKTIALIGGTDTNAGGQGKCGYFMIGFTTGNGLAMGVQCNGGGSDTPLGTTQNLTSNTPYLLAFCYDGTTEKASILVDNVLAASAQKSFVFPRQGQVTILGGSHDADVELMEGVTLSSLNIGGYTEPTPTPVPGGGGPMVSQNEPFAMEAMPRTVAALRTATITKTEWPPDFCLNAVISTPVNSTGVRAIAMVGGGGHCGNFVIFFGEGNTIGMGVQCDAAGSSPPLVTTSVVPEGVHALSFCYGRNEKKAQIAVDGNLKTMSDRMWNYPGYGNVSVLVGSHERMDEALEGCTLQSLSMEEHNPLAPPEIPTDAMGNTDFAPAIAPTSVPKPLGFNSTAGTTNTTDPIDPADAITGTSKKSVKAIAQEKAAAAARGDPIGGGKGNGSDPLADALSKPRVYHISTTGAPTVAPVAPTDSSGPATFGRNRSTGEDPISESGRTAVDALGSLNAAINATVALAKARAAVTTTTTTTTTTTIIREHMEYSHQASKNSGVSKSHHRTAYDTTHHDDTGSSYNHHLEGR